MKKTFVLVVISLVALGCVNPPKEKVPSGINYFDLYSNLINRHKARGIDVTQVHRVTFTIECKTEQQVAALVKHAIALGFEDDYIAYSEERKTWSSDVNTYMKLEAGRMVESRNSLLPHLADACSPLKLAVTFSRGRKN
jgi:hypothetical protein